MTFLILWTDDALAAAQQHVNDDRDGLLAVFEVVDQLADDPSPADAFSWGPGVFRRRVGRYRIVYALDGQARTVHVVHLGRRP